MAWDAGRERVVLFGGRNGTFVLDTTWEYDGTNWTWRTPAHVPRGRFDAGMAYDRARQRIVMFGGAATSDLGDTWEWDGTDWQQVVTAHAPSARRLHVMAFDETRGVTMLFGGGLGAPGTWTFDGTDWTLHSVSDPGSRDGAAAVWSPFTQRILLFGGSMGGQTRDDLWQWDGTAWTALPQATRPFQTVYHSMAYDRHLGGILLHGGSVNGTWFWNGIWQRLTVDEPPLRSAGAMVHMDTLARTIVFGGGHVVYPNLIELNDLWETSFRPGQLAFGAGCGAPALSLSPAANAPQLGTVWLPTVGNVPMSPGVAFLSVGLSRTTFAGAPLPMSLTPFGLTGCNLLQDTALAIAVPADPAVAGSATARLEIPMLPVLAGLGLFAQAWAVAPGANAAGVVVSGAVEVILGN